eukprot:Tbor_TRINITY_DN5222_c0_g4::TRINITY_DN5222_c0_g4_i2::g.16371::m.16371
MPGPGDKTTQLARKRYDAYIKIVRHQRCMSFLKKMIIPSVLAYGFFITRPRKYSFISYTTQRRRYEPNFNALFPDLNQGRIPTSADYNQQLEMITSHEDSPIELQYRDCIFFGLAWLKFIAQDGSSHQLRFIGALGSFWTEY